MPAMSHHQKPELSLLRLSYRISCVNQILCPTYLDGVEVLCVVFVHGAGKIINDQHTRRNAYGHVHTQTPMVGCVKLSALSRQQAPQARAGEAMQQTVCRCTSVGKGIENKHTEGNGRVHTQASNRRLPIQASNRRSGGTQAGRGLHAAGTSI